MFNPGDRVKWAHPEASAEEGELTGKVRHVIVQYRVDWDDGTDDVCDPEDLEADVS